MRHGKCLPEFIAHIFEFFYNFEKLRRRHNALWKFLRNGAFEETSRLSSVEHIRFPFFKSLSPEKISSFTTLSSHKKLCKVIEFKSITCKIDFLFTSN